MRWKAEQERKNGGRKRKERGLFPETGPVAVWRRKELRAGARDRSRPILINFHARWCTHCVHMAPQYTRAALLLGEDVIVAAVDCADDESLCQSEQVQGYPTVRLLLPAPEAEVDTFAPEGPGGDQAEAIVSWVQGALRRDLVRITSAGAFKKTVLGSNETWIVDFSAGEWCPPCTALKPIMRQLASRFAGPGKPAVRVAIVDCDAARSLCQDQEVGFFPMLKLFPPGTSGGTKRAKGVPLHVDPQKVHSFPPGAALDLTTAVLEALIAPRPAAPQAVAHADTEGRAQDEL